MIQSIVKLGRVTSSSVKKCTGKSWDEWIEILNAAGAANWPHSEIVTFLKKKFKLRPWWQQGVTSGYELHLERRIEGQTLKGDYSTTATKSFPIGKKTAWALLSSSKGLSIWLKPISDFQLKLGSPFEVHGGIFGEVRTIKAGERVRMFWQESHWEKHTVVQVFIVGHKKGKCIVVIQHDQLKTAAQKMQMSRHWKKALTDLLTAVS